MLRSIGTAMAAALWLAASSNPVRVTASAPEDPAREAIAMGSGGPPAKHRGGCWGQDTIPAVIETVTDTVQDQPELRDATDKITQPASYKSTVSQRIRHDHQSVYIRAPCYDKLTPDTIATLQPALTERGY